MTNTGSTDSAYTLTNFPRSDETERHCYASSEKERLSKHST